MFFSCKFREKSPFFDFFKIKWLIALSDYTAQHPLNLGSLGHDCHFNSRAIAHIAKCLFQVFEGALGADQPL